MGVTPTPTPPAPPGGGDGGCFFAARGGLLREKRNGFGRPAVHDLIGAVEEAAARLLFNREAPDMHRVVGLVVGCV